MKYFCLIYDSKNIIRDKTCYKNPENPKCIDPIMIKKEVQNYEISEAINKLYANLVTNLKIVPNENFETAIEYKTGIFNTK